LTGSGERREEDWSNRDRRAKSGDASGPRRDIKVSDIDGAVGRQDSSAVARNGSAGRCDGRRENSAGQRENSAGQRENSAGLRGTIIEIEVDCVGSIGEEDYYNRNVAPVLEEMTALLYSDGTKGELPFLCFK
jgi:hypothetical protein